MLQNWCKPVHKESAVIGGFQTENDLLDSHGSERTMLVLALLIALVAMMMVLVQYDSLSENGMSDPVDFQDPNDINNLEDSEINGEGNADPEMIEDLPRVDGTRAFNDGITVNGIIGTGEWNSEDQVDVGDGLLESNGDATVTPPPPPEDPVPYNEDAVDIVDIFLANDDSTLYIRVDYAAALDIIKYDYNIFLDTDQNTATGLSWGWWATGGDYLIQDGHLYEWKEIDEVWVWSWVKAVSWSTIGGHLETCVSREDIPDTPSSGVNMLIATYQGWINLDDAPNSYWSDTFSYDYHVNFITVDGKITAGEWSDDDQVDVDLNEEDEAEVADAKDWLNLYITNDGTFLYFRMDLVEDAVYSSYDYIIYLDTDQERDPLTGFTNGWWGIGADHRIVNIGSIGYLQTYDGSWDNPGTQVDWEIRDNHIECSVARHSIGAHSGVDVIFHTPSAVEDYAPQWPGSLHYEYEYYIPPDIDIAIDGEFGDWNNPRVTILDENLAEGIDPKIDLDRVWVGDDTSNLYLRMDTVGDHSGNWVHIYLDTDHDITTGFNSGWMSIGAEYAVDGGSLLRYTGSGADWTWAVIGPITQQYSADGKYHEIVIDRSVIGLSNGAREEIYLFFDINGMDYAPDVAGSTYDYKLITPSHITIDGDLTDWTGPRMNILASGLGDATDDNYDIARIWATNDAHDLYLRMDVDGVGAQNYQAWHVYLDTDQDMETGFRGGDGFWSIGAEFMVESGTLYEYLGSGMDWQWTAIQSIEYRFDTSKQYREMKIPRSAIGETDIPVENTDMIFQLGSSVTGEDYAPDDVTLYHYNHQYFINCLGVTFNDISPSIVYPYTSDPLTTEYAMMEIVLYAVDEPATLTSITIERIGGGSSDSDVDKIILMDGSTALAEGVFSNGEAEIILPAGTEILEDTSRIFTIIYDLAHATQGVAIGGVIQIDGIDTDIDVVPQDPVPVYSWIETIPVEDQTGTRLCIYYGSPSQVNGAGGDVEVAVADFAKYDVIIFCDELVDTLLPPNSEGEITQQIIDGLHALKDDPEWEKDIKIYGYVPAILDAATMETYIYRWFTVYNADGIFWDPAGYDFGVSRSDQNAIIDLVHNDYSEKSIIISAWNPDDVMGDDYHSTMNPNRVPTSLRPGDGYLLENVFMANGVNQDAEAAREKLDICYEYRQALGIQMYVVDTGDENTNAQAHVNYAWNTILAYGFDGYQYTDALFSSADNWNKDKLPEYTMEYPENMGTEFLSNDFVDDGINGYSRSTDAGVFQVDFNGHTAVFTNIYGHIHGTVKLYDIDPIAGIVIDLEDSSGTKFESLETDLAGAYQFDGLVVGIYYISIIPFNSMKPHDDVYLKTVEVIRGGSAEVNYNLIFAVQSGACEPQGVGYWKHQVNAYLSKKGKMHETPEDVHDWALQISAFSPFFSFEGDIDTVFEEIRDTLKPDSKSMKAKALRQLLALNLNIVSLKLDPGIPIKQPKFIEDFGSPAGIVLDVLFECRLAILEEIDMETAKDMAEAINKGKYLVG